MTRLPHPLADVPPDARVKDVIGRLPRRDPVGMGLATRVGARGFGRPRFASGRRLYERMGVPDPWDPDAKQVQTGLGDVALPGSVRQPAPHLSPPAQAGPAGPKLPNLPRAPAAAPPGDSPPKGKPAPKIGDVTPLLPHERRPRQPDKPERAAPIATPPPVRPTAFGTGPVKHQVARLPVRPGVEVPPEGAPVDAPQPAVHGSARGSSAAEQRPAAATPRTPPAPPPAAATAATAPPRASGGVAPSARPSPPPTAPTETVVREPAPPTAAPPAAAPTPPPAPAPVNRRPPGPSAGLDDLFGMGAEMTRVRLPKNEPPPAEGEAPRPRRPMVTSPEELARLGLDRRPPPAKPPPNAARPSTPSAPSSDPLPDE